MIDPRNKAQADLLLQTIPFVAKELPAINWKLQNIIRLKKENFIKHKDMVRSLERALYV